MDKDFSLSYDDIKKAYHIPDSVTQACFVRCNSKIRGGIYPLYHWQGGSQEMDYEPSPLRFTAKILESRDPESFIAEVIHYTHNCVKEFSAYQLISDDIWRAELEGLPSDERFDDDIELIGREIRDRINKLRSMGLSSLAIRKLIGDEPEKPSKLLIDKQNRVYLTDYGNKEIKLSPLHKAVFFLFLRHPEGIYFKNLSDYRDELSDIYKEITGREDVNGIEESIRRLTDPLDNSINEKCARIKNTFVSEFCEEVAQWYFIDGEKGERKSIRLPRELVTWEIKD